MSDTNSKEINSDRDTVWLSTVQSDVRQFNENLLCCHFRLWEKIPAFSKELTREQKIFLDFLQVLFTRNKLSTEHSFKEMMFIEFREAVDLLVIASTHTHRVASHNRDYPRAREFFNDKAAKAKEPFKMTRKYLDDKIAKLGLPDLTVILEGMKAASLAEIASIKTKVATTVASVQPAKKVYNWQKELFSHYPLKKVVAMLPGIEKTAVEEVKQMNSLYGTDFNAALVKVQFIGDELTIIGPDTRNFWYAIELALTKNGLAFDSLINGYRQLLAKYGQVIEKITADKLTFTVNLLSEEESLGMVTVTVPVTDHNIKYRHSKHGILSSYEATINFEINWKGVPVVAEQINGMERYTSPVFDTTNQYNPLIASESGIPVPVFDLSYRTRNIRDYLARDLEYFQVLVNTITAKNPGKLVILPIRDINNDAKAELDKLFATYPDNYFFYRKRSREYPYSYSKLSIEIILERAVEPAITKALLDKYTTDRCETCNHVLENSYLPGFFASWKTVHKKTERIAGQDVRIKTEWSEEVCICDNCQHVIKKLPDIRMSETLTKQDDHGNNYTVKRTSSDPEKLSWWLSLPSSSVSQKDAKSLFNILGAVFLDKYEIKQDKEQLDLKIKTGDDPLPGLGGLSEVKMEINDNVMLPFLYRDKYREMGAKTSKGILLYGPPGCGKTLIARLIAKRINATFMNVDFTHDKYVGADEKRMKEIFETARNSAPCVIFFDEIDAVAPRRSNLGDSSASHGFRSLVNTLLKEMDGIEENKNDGIMVIAASNYPEAIDPALLRPGRFTVHVEVPFPDEDARKEILSIHLANKKVSSTIDIDKLASLTDNFTGAAIEGAINDALLRTVRKMITESGKEYLTQEELETSIEKLQKSEEMRYNKFQKRKDQYLRPEGYN